MARVFDVDRVSFRPGLKDCFSLMFERGVACISAPVV